MKRKISTLLGFLLIVGILFLCIDGWCFAKPFYAREYGKLGTAAEIGITEDELNGATDALLDYLKDRRDDLVTYAKIDGSEREVFDEREKLHMVDVKNLYLAAEKLAYIGTAVSVVGYGILVYFSRKDLLPVLKGYRDSNVILLVLAAAIGVYAAMDFDTFWINFHLLFFTNDLWLLDPSCEILIQMVPEQFFMDLVIGIAATFVFAAAAILIFSIYLEKKIKKNGTETNG